MENGTKPLRTAVVLLVALCVPAGTLVVGTDKAGPTLARDGEALAKIVIPAEPPGAVQFAAVAKVAESIKDLEGKYVTTLAYGPKRYPPQSVALPDNVCVRLCISGSAAAIKLLAHQTQMELIRQWSERMSGDLCLWTYPNTSWYKGLGVVETMPHAAAKRWL